MPPQYPMQYNYFSSILFYFYRYLNQFEPTKNVTYHRLKDFILAVGIK